MGAVLLLADKEQSQLLTVQQGGLGAGEGWESFGKRKWWGAGEEEEKKEDKSTLTVQLRVHIKIALVTTL